MVGKTGYVSAGLGQAMDRRAERNLAFRAARREPFHAVALLRFLCLMFLPRTSLSRLERREIPRRGANCHPGQNRPGIGITGKTVSIFLS